MNSFECCLNNTPHQKGIHNATDPAFQQSNQMLDPKLKGMTKHGEQNVKYKPAIEREDLQRLKESAIISPTTPQGLLYNAWFHFTLYFCITAVNSTLTATLFFFQFPRRFWKGSDELVWYENRCLGLNKLHSMIKELSKARNLSQSYTNHCIRSTAITLWSNAGLPNRHIMTPSGHSNENSLKSYNASLSSQQLQVCSSVLSSALNPQATQADQSSVGTSSSLNNLDPPLV